MNKWESTISSTDIPVHMYKISPSMVKVIGEENCKKGVNVKGYTLFDSWYGFKQEQNKLTELVHGQSSSSYLDYRVFSKSKNEVLYEKVESVSESEEKTFLNMHEYETDTENKELLEKEKKKKKN